GESSSQSSGTPPTGRLGGRRRSERRCAAEILGPARAIAARPTCFPGGPASILFVPVAVATATARATKAALIPIRARHDRMATPLSALRPERTSPGRACCRRELHMLAD